MQELVGIGGQREGKEQGRSQLDWEEEEEEGTAGGQARKERDRGGGGGGGGGGAGAGMENRQQAALALLLPLPTCSYSSFCSSPRQRACASAFLVPLVVGQIITARNSDVSHTMRGTAAPAILSTWVRVGAAGQVGGKDGRGA